MGKKPHVNAFNLSGLFCSCNVMRKVHDHDTKSESNQQRESEDQRREECLLCCAAFDLTRCAVETDYLRYATRGRAIAADLEKEHRREESVRGTMAQKITHRWDS